MILTGESEKANFIVLRISSPKILLTSGVFAILTVRDFRVFAFGLSEKINNLIFFNMSLRFSCISNSIGNAK